MLKDLKTLIGLNSAAFMMMLGVGMTMAILPQRIINLTGSGSAVGYIASAFAISYIVLQVPIGNLSDKLGFKFFLVLGYLLCGITGLLYYFSNNVNLIFLGRVFQGAGEAPIWALAPALLSIKFSNSKGKVIGIYNTAIHIGLAMGPILGIFVLEIWTANQAFLFYAFTCLIGAIITLVTVDNGANNKVPNNQMIHFKNILVLMDDRKILVVLAGIMLYGAGYGIFLTVIPAYLISVRGFSQTFIGLFFSLFYLAISLSQIITGHLSDKMGREKFMINGLVIAALGLSIFSGFNQPWISIILTLVSVGLGVFYLSSMAFLNEMVPNSLKGTISGSYYLFWGIGFFFGPVFIGKLGELPGFNIGFYVYSITLTLLGVSMFFIYKKGSVRKKEISR